MVTALFPYSLSPITNVAPFTYRDGATYLEILEALRQHLTSVLEPSLNAALASLLDEFQAGIANAETRIVESETEYQQLMQDAKDYVDASIQYINNKTGDAQIQRYDLTTDLVLGIDPLWPNNHPVSIVITQDSAGGHAVTFTPDINGSITIDTAPDAVTSFTLVPEGDGDWQIVKYIDKSIFDAALALKANASALALKADKTELLSKATIVTSFAELQAAVTTGGIIRGGNTQITITSQLEVTAPTRFEGGNYVLPAGATYSAFRVTSSNVSFTNVTFTGGGTGTGTLRIDGARFIHAQGTADTYLRNIKTTGCTMTGCQDENVRYAYVRDSVIANNVIDNFLYAGVMIISGEETTVANNVITNAVMKAPVVNVYGVAVTDLTNEVATRSRNVKIIGNTIRSIEWEGIDTHGGEAIVIQGNTVDSCGRGIALVVGNDDRLTTPTNCVVTGNYVDKGSDTQTGREGISLWGLSSNFATAIITGNIVRGYANDKSITLTQYDARRTLVEGNSHPMIPWTGVNMDNGAQWVVNDAFPPEYMIDGRTVYLRGMVTPAGTQTTAAQRIGGLPTVARPGALTFYKQTRGSNSASSTNATLASNPNGALEMYYRNNTNDFYSYPIDGSYQRDYLGAQ